MIAPERERLLMACNCPIPFSLLHRDPAEQVGGGSEVENVILATSEQSGFFKLGFGLLDLSTAHRVDTKCNQCPADLQVVIKITKKLQRLLVTLSGLRETTLPVQIHRVREKGPREYAPIQLVATKFD